MAYRVEDIGLNPNYPLFTPAASAMYVRHCTKLPPEKSNKLNWYTPENKELYWPASLYSAGAAHLELPNSRTHEAMITQRDRSKTILISDSGGYQLGSGTFSGADKFRSDIHGRAADKIRNKIIIWSEEFSDYSMTIDFPTWALGSPNYLFNDFHGCLYETIYNCAYIQENRTPNKTRFLNVIQGNKYLEAVEWYNEVRQFDFEGWSLAGQVAYNPDITVRILLNLWRDGNIRSGRNWVHILGHSNLSAIWVNNIYHRCLRKYVHKDAQLSYDSSSTVRYGVYGQDVKGADINYDEMKITTAQAENVVRDTGEYCRDIFSNMVAQAGYIDRINKTCDLPQKELEVIGPVPQKCINFKADVEAIFQAASEIGIDQYPIDDVDLKRYKRMIA